MTPEDLAARHPRLFHVTRPEAWPSIERHGLLPPTALAAMAGLEGAAREALLRARRGGDVTLAETPDGPLTLTDQLPLSEAALERCLTGGMAPADWIAALNERVFLWADEARVEGLLNARANRARPRLVLTFDTLSLVAAYAPRVALSPINSGSTIRRPAPRGPETFTPLGAMGYEEWRRRRGRLDRVVEVTVVGGVPDAARHLLSRRIVSPRPRSPASTRPSPSSRGSRSAR